MRKRLTRFLTIPPNPLTTPHRKVLTVRFEDFISDQEAVLREICTFLGVPFAPEMLDVTRSEEAVRISGQGSELGLGGSGSCGREG